MPQPLIVKSLVDLLMSVINQACQSKIEKRQFFLDHRCLTSYEEAFDFLVNAGYLKEIKRGKNKGLFKIIKW